MLVTAGRIAGKPPCWVLFCRFNWSVEFEFGVVHRLMYGISNSLQSCSSITQNRSLMAR